MVIFNSYVKLPEGTFESYWLICHSLTKKREFWIGPQPFFTHVQSIGKAWWGSLIHWDILRYICEKSLGWKSWDQGIISGYNMVILWCIGHKWGMDGSISVVSPCLGKKASQKWISSDCMEMVHDASGRIYETRPCPEILFAWIHTFWMLIWYTCDGRTY